MSFDLELEGRRALVTGGTKGIGAALLAPSDRIAADSSVAALKADAAQLLV